MPPDRMKPMVEKRATYWFPAKRYGWGWGFPVRWQGWLVIAIYAGLLALSVVVFVPSQKIPAFILSAAGLTVVLVLVCWLKGEPPRWRWGEEQTSRENR